MCETAPSDSPPRPSAERGPDPSLHPTGGHSAVDIPPLRRTEYVGCAVYSEFSAQKDKLFCVLLVGQKSVSV